MPVKVLVISNYRETASVRPEAELFIGIQKAGLRVTVMTYGDALYCDKFRKAGIRVIDFHPERKLDKREIELIKKELAEGAYDILHLFNSKAIINGIQAARGLPVKVVLYRGYTGNVHWFDPSAYLKYLNPRVDKITCLARSVEEQIRNQLFFQKSKAVTIHKGHSPEWYRGIEPLDKSTFGIPKNSFLVTNVANNRPMKGIPYLLKATNFIPPELPIHFCLVGRDMDAGKNRRLIEKSPNRDKIHLTGYREDALRIVKASDVFVLSSTKGEAITKSVIEAMSLGVAPIITDIPGNKALLVNEKTGLVVPSKNPEAIAEAIMKLYKDRELCQKLGENAKRHIAAHFNIEDTILSMKSLYEELSEKTG